MKIILSKDVQNLGEEGDIREVARGYARNYLIPQGFGVAYTKQNLALLEGRKKAIEQRKEEKRDRAKGLKERIEGLDITIQMTAGETGRLFGSVTNAMIVEELSKLGIEVERKRIEIPEHTIKTVGNFVVKVKLYGSEIASLKVTVEGPKGKAPAAESAEAEGTEESTEAAEGTETEEATVSEGSEPVAEAAADESEVAEESESEVQAEASEESAVAEEPQAEATAETEPASEPSEPVAEESAEAEAPAAEASEEAAAEEPEAQADSELQAESEASEEPAAEDEEPSEKE